MNRPKARLLSRMTDVPYLWVLFILYAAANSSLPLNLDARYWDDWTLVLADSREILIAFSENGSFLNMTGYMHVALLSAGPWLYHLVTFGVWFAIALLFQSILSREAAFCPRTRFFVMLFFLCAPVFAARHAMIMTPSLLYVFLFVLGWWFHPRNRILSLLCFFFSFGVQSLLVFYAAPMLASLLRNSGHRSFAQLIAWTRGHLDYLLAPFVFFFVKAQFFAPRGRYEGYNADFDVSGIPGIAKTQLGNALDQRPDITLLLVCLAVLAPVFYRLKLADFQERRPFLLIAAGAFMLLAGLVPYWIVGHLPIFEDWYSRHQLLMPFGIAVGCAGVLQLLPARLSMAAAAPITAVFLAMSLETSWDFWRDNQKQKAMIAFMEQSDQIRNAELLLLSDSTPNALHRAYRAYELTGMLRLAFGDQSRFAIPKTALPRYEDGSYDNLFKDVYNAAAHRRHAEVETVEMVITQASDGLRITTRP